MSIDAAGAPRRVLAGWLAAAALLAAPAARATPPLLALVANAIGPAELAVVVNEADAASREVADYYQRRRGIPPENVIRVRIEGAGSALEHQRFAALRAEIVARTPARVQAYAVAWSAPYRVGCMGLTAALAFGFDEAWCSASCGATRASPYFNSPSRAPHDDLGVRPAMMLAGPDVAAVKALIDRGVAADFSYPAGTAYLVRTADAARNVRAGEYDDVANTFGAAHRIERVEAEALRERRDVMFYVIGAARVAGLDTLAFRPGAVADHLTSFGGQLTDSPQMSALAWIEAGATASYGTVTEPCNHPQKFPHTGALLWHYLNGESLIEAYWKSVAWPGEGVFVGEPLARPFGARLVERDGAPRLESYAAFPRRIAVETAEHSVGPFRRSRRPLQIPAGHALVALPRSDAAVLRILPRRRRRG